MSTTDRPVKWWEEVLALAALTLLWILILYAGMHAC